MSRGWIENRSDRRLKKWRARHRGADGKLRSKSFVRKFDAETWLDEQRASLRTGTWLDPDGGKQRYAEWFTVWLASKLRITDRTRFDYQGIYRSRLAATFGETPVRLINRRDVSDWRDGLLDVGLSAARVRKLHSVLSASLNAAVDEGLIARNPALRIELPRIESNRKRFLSAEEVATLADAMPNRGSRVLTLVAGYGGLRWGELVGLRRSRCLLLRRRLVIDSAVSDIGGRLVWKAPKSHQAREVSLPTFVIEALARHLEDVPADPDSLVFTAPMGGPLRYGGFRRRIWNGAVVRAGLSSDVTPHTLRHTCASLMHNAGADLVLVSRQLGHESPAVTGKVYVGLFDDAADDVMEKLDATHGATSAPPARPQQIAN